MNPTTVAVLGLMLCVYISENMTLATLRGENGMLFAPACAIWMALTWRCWKEIRK